MTPSSGSGGGASVKAVVTCKGIAWGEEMDMVVGDDVQRDEG